MCFSRMSLPILIFPCFFPPLRLSFCLQERQKALWQELEAGVEESFFVLCSVECWLVACSGKKHKHIGKTHKQSINQLSNRATKRPSNQVASTSNPTKQSDQPTKQASSQPNKQPAKQPTIIIMIITKQSVPGACKKL